MYGHDGLGFLPVSVVHDLHGLLGHVPDEARGHEE
jgi:hypothetical protein